MDFGEARKRVTRIASAPGHPQAKSNLIGSIIRQAGMRDSKAPSILVKEVNGESWTMTGNGTRQTGFGPGKKLGAGRWRYEGGKWLKVD
jgi:hypothetical protein